MFTQFSFLHPPFLLFPLFLTLLFFHFFSPSPSFRSVFSFLHPPFLLYLPFFIFLSCLFLFSSSSLPYITTTLTNHCIHIELILPPQLRYPGQVVEVEVEVEGSEGRAGGYRGVLVGRVDPPGRTLTLRTLLISRTDAHHLSYGLSNTLQLDTWISPVR